MLPPAYLCNQGGQECALPQIIYIYNYIVLTKGETNQSRVGKRIYTKGETNKVEWVKEYIYTAIARTGVE